LLAAFLGAHWYRPPGTRRVGRLSRPLRIAARCGA